MPKLKDRIIAVIGKSAAENFCKQDIRREIEKHFTEFPLLPMQIIFNATTEEMRAPSSPSDYMILPMSWYFEFVRHFSTMAGFIIKRRMTSTTNTSAVYELIMPESIN